MIIHSSLEEFTMYKSLLIASLAVASLHGVSQAQSPSTAPSGPVRNIVLVHGAFADGSSYARVIPLLQAQGYRVTAVQNPLSSLAADVEATRRAIAMQDGPVILVGHSWGGMVISEAGNDPRVAGLVYIAALVPTEGQSANDVLKPYPPTPGLGHLFADASGYLTLTRQGIEEDFVPDLPPAERSLVHATQGPWNSAALAETVAAPAWKTRPSWFIAVDDRMLPADYELAIAKRINAKTTKLAAGHVPMLSRPREVAAVILDAAKRATTLAASR
ncbi:MAG TPA: alpha/beta hydrolase [Gemmatimonadales bacterium]|nr:alpha/beta hydrolase [Gemmatimonadales bacterium]